MNSEIAVWAWVALMTATAALGAALTGRWLGLGERRRWAGANFLTGFLELALSLASLRMMIRAWGRLMVAGVTYGGIVAAGLAQASVWAGLAWLVMGPQLEARPLRAGETALLEARLRPAHEVMKGTSGLTGVGGMIVETPALRVLSEQAVYWRVRVENLEPTAGFLLDWDGRTTSVAVATQGHTSLAQRRIALRDDRHWETVRLHYPGRVLALWGHEGEIFGVWLAFTVILAEILQWVLTRRRPNAPYPGLLRTR